LCKSVVARRALAKTRLMVISPRNESGGGHDK
jgi:hypothetical protein